MTEQEEERAKCEAAAREIYFEHFAGRSVPHALNVLAGLMVTLIAEYYSEVERPAITALIVRELERNAGAREN